MDGPERRVELSNKVSPSVSMHLSASIEDRGLVISGQDVGPFVSSVWGDSDYEYWLVVDRAYLGNLVEQLSQKLGREHNVPDTQPEADELLLDLLRRAWDAGTFETDVDFRGWLNEINIPSEFQSYI